MRILDRGFARPLALSVIGVFATLAIDAEAQVRQSTDADLHMKEWHSPVTVEIPIEGVVATSPGAKWEVPSIPQFFCDDVTIDEIGITKSAPKKSGDYTLRIVTRLYVRAQEDDKAVSLEFSLVEGDQKEYLGRIEDIDGQAADRKTVWANYDLTKESFDRYFGEGRTPVLVVSMVVRTN